MSRVEVVVGSVVITPPAVEGEDHPVPVVVEAGDSPYDAGDTAGLSLYSPAGARVLVTNEGEVTPAPTRKAIKRKRKS